MYDFGYTPMGRRINSRLGAFRRPPAYAGGASAGLPGAMSIA